MATEKRIYHLEYKHKAGREKHTYYTTLTQLCRFNPLIGTSYHTLARLDFKEQYENPTVIIHKGNLVDVTVKKIKKGG